ncbi:MAG TPA: bile acid:sodium symporter family protein [Chitinophagales bacterium]|nr:bile acid:sodium symporter family protein [Chitinophagales bacterium]
MQNLSDLKIHFSPQSLTLLNIILAFIMFGIALELRITDFTSLFKNKKSAIAGLTAHFILLPLLTFCLTILLHPPPTVALGMILVGACPGGNMSNMFTHFAKGNTALAVALTSVSHFLAIILTPLNFSFYGGLNPATATLLRTIHLSFLNVFQTILLVVGIPLLLGMLFRHFIPAVASHVTKWMKRLSLIIFGGFIVAVFAGNAGVFLQSAAFILPLVVLHNALALGTGYTFASLLKLPLPDRRTITFETGVQNSGLGLLLIFTFFDGMSGMALVAATWGVWHLITGSVLAWLWGRNK